MPKPQTEKHENRCVDAREFKITFMLSLVLGYFCVEMFVGYRFNSLALVADACHMLSDGLCLVVALGTVFDRPFLTENRRLKCTFTLVQWKNHKSRSKSGKKIESGASYES